MMQYKREEKRISRISTLGRPGKYERKRDRESRKKKYY